MKSLHFKYALLISLLLIIIAAPAAAMVQQGTSVQFGKQIIVPVNTTHNGDLVVIFNEVRVDGVLNGDAVAIAGNITVNGQINGDVVSVGGKVNFGENGVVQGDVTSVGNGIVGDRARISGTINDVNFGMSLRSLPFVPQWWYKGITFRNPAWHLFLMAGWLAIALITLSFFPNASKGVRQVMEQQPLRSTLVGLLAWFLLIPATLMLLITIVAIPFIPLLYLGFLAAKVLGYTSLALLLGDKVSQTTKSKPSSLTQLAIGVLILGLVGYVPVLNSFVSLFVSLISIGAVVDSKFGSNRPWLPPRTNPNIE